MARVHYCHYLTNEEGQPVEDAEISVMQAETETYLWIYDEETAGTAFVNYEKSGSTGNAQLRTDTDGYFEFWLADSSDAGGHGYSGIKVKIKWAKEGVITSDFIDNIEFNIAPDAVTETDSVSTAKNKLVSNNLAYRWESAVKRVFELKVTEWATSVTVNDEYYFIVPDECNGMVLTRVAASVITAGTTNSTTIQVVNVTDTQNMLSTVMSIDTTKTSTRTSATQAVIDTAHDDVATGDVLKVDVTGVSSTAPKGLIVELVFTHAA